MIDKTYDLLIEEDNLAYAMKLIIPMLLVRYLYVRLRIWLLER